MISMALFPKHTIRHLIYLTVGVCWLSPIYAQSDDLPDLSTRVEAMAVAEFQAILDASKRWGEFGTGDQAGSINLISPETRINAANEVRDGIAINLSNPISKTARIISRFMKSAFLERKLASREPEITSSMARATCALAKAHVL